MFNLSKLKLIPATFSPAITNMIREEQTRARQHAHLVRR